MTVIREIFIFIFTYHSGDNVILWRGRYCPEDEKKLAEETVRNMFSGSLSIVDDADDADLSSFYQVRRCTLVSG